MRVKASIREEAQYAVERKHNLSILFIKFARITVVQVNNLWYCHFKIQNFHSTFLRQKVPKGRLTSVGGWLVANYERIVTKIGEIDKMPNLTLVNGWCTIIWIYYWWLMAYEWMIYHHFKTCCFVRRKKFSLYWLCLYKYVVLVIVCRRVLYVKIFLYKLL